MGSIDEINNNWINTKYRQMAFRSTRWRCSRALFENPWSNESDANVEDSDSAQYEFVITELRREQRRNKN